MQNSFYIGKQVGNYRITNVLASGSFGTVFQAHHLYLKQRIVVIKFLHAIRLGSEEEKEQFLQEAQILEMLRGLPHILPLLDVGVENESDIPYLITEYAEHGSLRQRMKTLIDNHLPQDEAMTIITQIGEGLQAAHDQQIVHRDLKPENILFNAKDDALLADFGISTVLSSSSIKHTDIIGTPAYMAPEQFRGEVSKESDQYALACIAYELFTGLKPFNAPDIVSLGFLHTSENPIPPREHNYYIPVHVEQAILKALSKQRADRFPSVAAFVEALTHESQHIRSNTRPLTVAEMEADDETLPAIPPVAGPTIASTPSTPDLVSSPASANQQSAVDMPSPPPLYLPDPSEIKAKQSTPFNPNQPSGVGNSQPTPPPYAYGPQNISRPPARPARPGSAQPISRPPVQQVHPQPSGPHPAQAQVQLPPNGAGQRQAQRYAQPSYSDAAPYLKGGYYVPNSVRAHQIPFHQRMLAVACYVLPVISWVIFFRTGQKGRFSNFHFIQSVLSWLIWAICMFQVQNIKAGGTTFQQALVVLCYLALLILLLPIVQALKGRYYKLWLIGALADKLAGRPDNFR